jgi:hypothetical protein
MAGFLFRLEYTGGVPADPPTMTSGVPNWKAGDTIPFGRRMLRVVAVRDDDADQPLHANRGRSVLELPSHTALRAGCGQNRRRQVQLVAGI